MTAPVKIADAKEVLELLRVLEHRPYVGLWLDTWFRVLSASGGHDSDPKVVAPSIAPCDVIRRELDCTVTIVHHVGWSPDAKTRPKGMVDLPGAIDGATYCLKNGIGALLVGSDPFFLGQSPRLAELAQRNALRSPWIASLLSLAA